MKKLISLILCIVFVCLALVSCKQEKIGEYLSNYQNDDSSSNVIEKLNFYIITGDGTSEEAKITVPQNINTYIKEKYKIELNIKYFTEDEYYTAVTTAMSTQVEAERPDIVLINGVNTFDALKSSLVPLNTADFNFYGEDYKKLNTIVKSVLLQASAEDGVYYTVPNNHSIGNYESVVFNKEMAIENLRYRNEFDFGNPNKLVTNVNTDTAVSRFESEVLAYDSGLDVSDYIKVITNGTYADYEALKYIDLVTGEVHEDEVNFVNIKAYPNVTRDEAHLSAFAVVKQLNDDGVYETEEEKALLKNHYSKCMRIIYALNDDAQLKNMLQYGYVGTNYTHVTNEKNEITNQVKLITDPAVRYEMNHIYTGNSFNPDFYYCEEIGWNKTTYDNWSRQIADSQLPSVKISSELAGVTLSAQVASGDAVSVATHGTTYSDVVITWYSESTDVVIDNTNGTLTFNNVAETTTVVIQAQISCAGTTVTKDFTVTVSVAE